MQSDGGTPSARDESVHDLAEGVNQLVAQMRKEQEIVRQWADEQSSQQNEVMGVIRDLVSDSARRR